MWHEPSGRNPPESRHPERAAALEAGYRRQAALQARPLTRKPDPDLTQGLIDRTSKKSGKQTLFGGG